MDLRTNTNNSNKISTTNTVPFSKMPNSEYINQSTKIPSTPSTLQISDDTKQTPLVRKNNDINSENNNLNPMANNTILYYDVNGTVYVILFVVCLYFY